MTVTLKDGTVVEINKEELDTIIYDCIEKTPNSDDWLSDLQDNLVKTIAQSAAEWLEVKNQ